MNQGIEFVQSSTPVKIYTKLKNVLKKWDLRDCSICFDVDETLLLNHEDDSYSVIKEARSFYNECKKLNLKIFIITARPKTKNGLTYLIQQLNDLKYDLNCIPHGGIYMMPKKYYEAGQIGLFKSLARNHIERKFNTKVIVMCGDRWTDVSVSQHPHVSKDLAHLLVWPDKNVPIGVKLPEVD